MSLEGRLFRFVSGSWVNWSTQIIHGPTYFIQGSTWQSSMMNTTPVAASRMREDWHFSSNVVRVCQKKKRELRREPSLCSTNLFTIKVMSGTNLGSAPELWLSIA